MSELGSRARAVLYHAIVEYVATGEPVGSRTIAKKSGLELSPASIRNVLADLEEQGYLYQPHTSAGRVPTDKAFRLFIDVMMEVQELSPDQLRLIQERFQALGSQSLESSQVAMREAGRLLSSLTGAAAVIVAPKAEVLTLRTLRFIPVSKGELLAVLVLSNGMVQNRFVHADVSESDLTEVHNLLEDVIEGRSLGELRDLFARRLSSERVQNDALRKRAFELGDAVVKNAASEAADLVVEGRSQLLERADFQGPDGWKSVVTALDAREQLVALLDATLSASGVTVVVGSEAGSLGGGQLSFVGANFADHGVKTGAVGIIGPTRMDYPRVVPVVKATAQAISRYMADRTGRPRVRKDDDD